MQKVAILRSDCNVGGYLARDIPHDCFGGVRSDIGQSLLFEMLHEYLVSMGQDD